MSQTRPRRRSTPTAATLSPRFPSPHASSSSQSPSAHSTALSPDVTPKLGLLPYRKPEPADTLFSTTHDASTDSYSPSTVTSHPSIRIVPPKAQIPTLEALEELWDEESHSPPTIYKPTLLKNSHRAMANDPHALQIPVVPSRSSKRRRPVAASMSHAGQSSRSFRIPPPTYVTESEAAAPAARLFQPLEALRSTIELVKRKTNDRDVLAVRRALTKLGLRSEDVEVGSSAASIQTVTSPGWPLQKWALLVSLIVLLAYSCTGFLLALKVWLNASDRAEVYVLVDQDLLICATVFASLGILATVTGLAGTVVNSRHILVFYNILLLPALFVLAAIAYIALQRAHGPLDKDLDQLWLRELDDWSRLRIQNSLDCCGYYNSLHAATFSQRCYPRVQLPGCKGLLLQSETSALHDTWVAALALLPVHILVMIAAIAGSKHASEEHMKGERHEKLLTMADVREHAFQAMRKLTEQEKISPAHRSPPASIHSFDSLPSESALLGLGLEMP